MPREYIPGGVVDIAGGTQKLSWGTGANTLTPITWGMVFKLRAAGSASYDVVWGHSNQRAFFILDGVSTRRMRFSVYTSGVERSSGLCTALALDTWYTIIGGYDKDAGSNNLFIRVYTMDGSLYSSSSATVTGALDTAGSTPLVFGSDTVKNPDQPINAQGKNFRIWTRLLTSTECDGVALNIIDRTNLVLETKCDVPGDSQPNTGINPNVYNATLSGGARTVPKPPTELSRSRQSVSNRISSTYDSGYSILANGSSQLCSRNDTATGTNGTIFIRFKTRSLTTNQTIIGISIAGSDQNNIDFTLVSGVPRVKINVSGSNVLHATLPKINSEWHSILWKGGSGGNQVFFDGIDITSSCTYVTGTSATTSWLSSLASPPTRIVNGAFMISSTTNYFNGWLDEFKMWDRKLTDKECQRVHAGATVSRTGLFWEWLYNENTGTSVADTSPSGNHTGTITSSGMWSSGKAISPRVEI